MNSTKIKVGNCPVCGDPIFSDKKLTEIGRIVIFVCDCFDLGWDEPQEEIDE